MRFKSSGSLPSVVACSMKARSLGRGVGSLMISSQRSSSTCESSRSLSSTACRSASVSFGSSLIISDALTAFSIIWSRRFVSAEIVQSRKLFKLESGNSKVEDESEVRHGESVLRRIRGQTPALSAFRIRAYNLGGPLLFMNGENRSIGTGRKVVVLCSLAISRMVWRKRSCNAIGSLLIIAAACTIFSAA